MANTTFGDIYGTLETPRDIVRDYTTPESEEFSEDNCMVLNATNPLKDNNSYHTSTRVMTLIAEIVLGNIGCLLVIVWLWTNSRRLKSRVNLLILYVTIADLFVAEFTILSQLIMESMGTEWLAGDFMCRLVKFLQIVGMFASTNMLLMLAFDRHQAIRSPLKQPIKVWILALIAWVVAAAGALPQMFLFEVSCLKIIQADGVTVIPVCRSYLRREGAQPWETQVYLVYSSILSFFFPVTFLLVAYFRIFLKICKKERENREQSNGDIPLKPGKIRLHSTNSASLRKAKTKTLIMTIVIVLMYIICTVPYIFVEMWRLANAGKPPPPFWPKLAAVALSMLPTNSVINPYVFLLFNANLRCFRDFCERCKGQKRRKDVDSHVSTRSEFFTNSLNPKSGPNYHSHFRDNNNPHSSRKVDFCNGGRGIRGRGSTDIELKPLKP